MGSLSLGALKPYRVWLLLLAVLPCALLALGVFLIARPRPRITQDACDEIQVGMDEEEVEGIIGGPPGNYSPWWRGTVHLKWTTRGAVKRQQWNDSSGIIVVCYDGEGRVIGKKFVRFGSGLLP